MERKVSQSRGENIGSPIGKMFCGDIGIREIFDDLELRELSADVLDLALDHRFASNHAIRNLYIT